jgi:DNA-dependent RNA polymerase auxiliary subunit epsilon
MDIKTMPSNIVYLENYTNTESLDELLADENFIIELIELINQNFVLEVKACHAHDE